MTYVSFIWAENNKILTKDHCERVENILFSSFFSGFSFFSPPQMLLLRAHLFLDDHLGCAWLVPEWENTWDLWVICPHMRAPPSVSVSQVLAKESFGSLLNQGQITVTSCGNHWKKKHVLVESCFVFSLYFIVSASVLSLLPCSRWVSVFTPASGSS